MRITKEEVAKRTTTRLIKFVDKEILILAKEGHIREPLKLSRFYPQTRCGTANWLEHHHDQTMFNGREIYSLTGDVKGKSTSTTSLSPSLPAPLSQNAP